MFGHQPGFIALHRADAMPLQRQIGQRLDFFHRLLDVVLAKRQLPGGIGLGHGLGPEGLGDGQQTDLRRVAPAGAATGGDAATDTFQIVFDFHHDYL